MPTPGADGCGGYQIRRLAKFETSYADLLKKHYRKDKKGREEFIKLVEDYIGELESSPCSDCVSDEEIFPADTADPDFDFRKKRWRNLPRLQGCAKFGRLMFVVYHPQKIVYLVWIYTHAEYQKPKSRPPEKDLKVQVNDAKRAALQQDPE